MELLPWATCHSRPGAAASPWWPHLGCSWVSGRGLTRVYPAIPCHHDPRCHVRAGARPSLQPAPWYLCTPVPGTMSPSVQELLSLLLLLDSDRCLFPGRGKGHGQGLVKDVLSLSASCTPVTER